MKTLITFFILLFAVNNTILSQEPTYAGLPDSSHVLVVYNLNSSVSDSVMQYYVEQRHIPISNIVQLDSLPEREPLTYNGEEHIIKIVQSGDIIQDSTQAEIDSAQSGYQASFHVWSSFCGCMCKEKVC